MSHMSDLHLMLCEYAEDGRHADILSEYARNGRIPWSADAPYSVTAPGARVVFCRGYVHAKAYADDGRQFFSNGQYGRHHVLRWAGVSQFE